MQLAPLPGPSSRPMRRTHSATSDQDMATTPPAIPDSELLTTGRPLKRCRITDDGDAHMGSLSPSPAASHASFPFSSASSPSPSFASAALGARDGSGPGSGSGSSHASTMSVSVPHTPQPLPHNSLPPQHTSSPSSSRSSSGHDTHKPRSPSQQSQSPPHQQQQHTFWFDDGDLVLSVLNSSPDPSLSLQNLQQLQAQPEFALAAGNFAPPHQLAQAEQAPVYFRVHAARLVAASDAFADLLGTPLPSNPTREASAKAAEEIAACLRPVGDTSVTEIAGCPYVRLDDSPRDWAVALEAIYEQMSFQHRALVFESLAAVLRIATKYVMRPLRAWCVAQLRATWPREITRMAPLALAYAAEAIALARKCDVPEILPAAFYALAIQKWRPSPSATRTTSALASSVSAVSGPSSGYGIGSGRRSPRLSGGGGVARNGSDGGRAHIVLTPEDLRRVVAGREALCDVLVEIMANPLEIEGMMAEGLDDGLEREPGLARGHEGGGQQGLEGGHGVHGQYLISPAPSPSPKTPPSDPILPDSNMSISDVHDLPPSSYPSNSTSKRPHFTFCSPSSSPSPHNLNCRVRLEAMWRSHLAPDPRRAWNVWITRELHKMSTLPYPPPSSSSSSSPAADGESEGRASAWVEEIGAGTGEGERRGNVCSRCWEENRRLALWRLDWLGEAIPAWFA